MSWSNTLEQIKPVHNFAAQHKTLVRKKTQEYTHNFIFFTVGLFWFIFEGRESSFWVSVLQCFLTNAFLKSELQLPKFEI